MYMQDYSQSYKEEYLHPQLFNVLKWNFSTHSSFFSQPYFLFSCFLFQEFWYKFDKLFPLNRKKLNQAYFECVFLYIPNCLYFSLNFYAKS